MLNDMIIVTPEFLGKKSIYLIILSILGPGQMSNLPCVETNANVLEQKIFTHLH